MTPRQERVMRLWEAHLAAEFRDRSPKAAVDTMVERPHVNHVPVLTGGVGCAELEDFYARYFIPRCRPIRRSCRSRARSATTASSTRPARRRHPGIHWDQASVLVQLGLLDPATLPVAGADTARKVLDPERPSNALMRR